MEVTEKVEPVAVAKKPRKRMKGILSKVREQMEFYFSDSNLSRDRFMSQQIKASNDGYVDLSLFLTFNKLKAITDDVKVIAKSLRDSQLIKVSDDGKKIKRVKPMCEPQELDERMVYVECLPHHVDYNWIRKMFSSCGKVNYVSLPRYKSTGDSKGFAFVEFDAVEGAKKACEELNNPPVEADDRPGKFPKTRKQLTQLQRKLGDDKDDTEVSEEQICQTEDIKDQDPKLTKRQKRRRRLTSESSIDGTSSDVSPVKRRKTSTETDRKCNEDDQDDEGGKKSKKKRKQRGSGHPEIIVGKKRREDEGEIHNEEKAEEKRKKRKSSGLDENSEGDSVESTDRKRKRKSVEASEYSEDRKKSSVVDNEENKKEEQSDNQKTEKSEKKRKRRKKKKQKEKDIPELRVISKKEWLELRAEYLSLQKKSMAELKKAITTLNAKKEDMKISNEKKEIKPKIEFVADVIVKVNCGQSLTVRELKSSLEPDLEVAYIDVNDGSNEGYIRCKNPESAKRLSEASSGAYFFTLVQGEEEQKYWTKLQADRETKLSKKTKDKRRGAQKLIDKAQKINKENMERRHIVFTD